MFYILDDVYSGKYTVIKSNVLIGVEYEYHGDGEGENFQTFFIYFILQVENL